MEEIEQEIKRIERLYSKLEKTENGTSDDWYYSGMLKGLREALRLVNTINYIPCCKSDSELLVCTYCGIQTNQEPCPHQKKCVGKNKIKAN